MFEGLLKYNTLPNMLTTHPPMQMDGNFGIVGGVCEILLQSHAGGIEIMPSPVDAWPSRFREGVEGPRQHYRGFLLEKRQGGQREALFRAAQGGAVRVNGSVTRVKTLPLQPKAAVVPAADRKG